jgi:hypothetical protein
MDLNIEIVGPGSVSVTPASQRPIDIPSGTWTGTFPKGTKITLVAHTKRAASSSNPHGLPSFTSPPLSHFDGWEGSINTTDRTVTFLMDTSKAVVAGFSFPKLVKPTLPKLPRKKAVPK